MLEPRHYSYLIRLWQEDGAGETGWRFVLVNLIEGQQWGFADLEELLAFLRDQVDVLSSRDLAQQCVDSGADSLFEQCQEESGVPEGGDAVTS